MPNPTLEDDIATVRACITTTGYPLEALAALDRLAKAVGGGTTRPTLRLSQTY